MSRIPAILAFPSRLKRTSQPIKTFFIVALICSIIIAPRAVVILSQGGVVESQDFQLRKYYGPLYNLIVLGDPQLTGGILTYKAPPGIHYYNPNIDVVDLYYTANLAHLKDSFVNKTPVESAMSLKQLGIKYLLIDPSTIGPLDDALNRTLSSITDEFTLSKLIAILGVWYLFEIGPFENKITTVPMSGWSVDTRFTQGPFSFMSNDSGLALELTSGATGDKVTAVNYAIPRLNLSDFDYIIIDATGDSNAQILFRLYLDDGSNLDVVYWKKLSSFGFFDLRFYANKTLRGDAYIALISSDGSPSGISISRIAFIDVTDH